MDVNRIKYLAGMLQLKGSMTMLIEDAVIPANAGLEQIEQMFDAAKRAIGIANKLKGEQKKRHLKVIFSNLNRIRAALSRQIEIAGSV